MLDRKQACGILGLPEGALREEIEDRYFVLVKRYRKLEPDEWPSPGEPVFARVNEAYRFLTGFTPMQRVQFKELNFKERLQHIRDNFVMEITFSLVIIIVISGIGIGINDIYKTYQASKDVGVYSPVQNPIYDYPAKK
jgi:hypothetical protein